MARDRLMRFGVVALILGLLLASGAPAYADRWSHADKRRDVAKLNFRGDFEVKPAPRDTTTDITRVTISHRPHRVVLRLRVRDLRPAESRSVVAYIKTPTDRHVVAVESLEVAFVARRAPRCAGLTKRFNYGTNLITIGVPRHCLGRPQWVRASVVMSTTAGALFDNRGSYHFDDGLSGRLMTLEDRPEFNPRIRR